MHESPTPLPTSRIVEPSMRVNALYQIALGLSMNDRSMGDLRFTLGAVRDGAYQPALRFANGELDLAIAVARGELDVAAVNPSAFLSMAYRGTGPYPEPLPLRVIAVMPSLDVMLFAVSERTGIRSFAEIRERRYPLRVSVRGSTTHGTRFVTDQVLAANGFSLKDIEAWGGSVHYASAPFDEKRIDGMRDGSLEAIFDEGVKGWAPLALAHGMRFLDLDARSRARLAELNWPAVPGRTGLPDLQEDILTPSFSGWPLFTRENLAEPLVYCMCQALEEAGPRTVWDSETPVSLADVCRNTDAAPFDIPLHPGAERYYRERGYLK
jgi:TRAP-type uncharacterized transport system substrate-binding protein